MKISQLTSALSVTPQLQEADIRDVAAQGFRTLICNRPAKESDDQPDMPSLENACQAAGLQWAYLPVISGQITDQDIQDFGTLLENLPKPILAFCRTGTRSTILWAMNEARAGRVQSALDTASAAGYDLSAQQPRMQELANANATFTAPARKHDVVIIGGGAAGLAVASSLLKRQGDLDIAIIEPRDTHYYQPGWTMVGGGIFTPQETGKPMADVMPEQSTWYRSEVSGMMPDQQSVMLKDGTVLAYRTLVVAAGLSLNWEGIQGLKETLGQHGVTSNYHYDTAPYTWELVQKTRKGKALFTQPPMPIKCAGAPQKAMYLSCDHWLKSGVLPDVEVEFCTAGGALFGVAAYVPALMEYIEKYGIGLNFMHNLVEVDGPNKTAVFSVTDKEGTVTQVEKSFDMLHVCPPQRAPEFIRGSSLADAAGWLDVDPQTLRHKTYGNVFALGDCANSPNAKTAAAVRQQAPVVAENVLLSLSGRQPQAAYDGYGSCPLTVERGKIVLAEFGYGGKLLPTFPTWLLEGKRPSRLSWMLKANMLPWLYWNAMLKGREWLAAPDYLSTTELKEKAEQACDFTGNSSAKKP
ncbi:TIGR01244 family sulfur transferase [Pokkaliibacter sp. CJK22405]|uniref:TIGR01244 family sulfur transferase n=1 Tax=Pokkaliibacter sp. CJK22405 TaxID=3384615 RepID=UPI003985270B